MIPIRVKVEGFLSYRNAAILEFDGASLWMLTGANGAGKSAVFDAVTFALYGAHRGGKQNADKLINHDSDKLTVEFDFRLGADICRARRTEHRRGLPTRQIIHVAGPNPPPHGATDEAMEPETDSRAGFDNWVKTHIGLSYEAFKASVLLRQGESDALLKMDSRERHELLTQLVDLSRYVRLYERAKDKFDEHTKQEVKLVGHLEHLPIVSPEAIAELEKVSETNRQVSGVAQTELQNIAALQVHANHWRVSKDKLAQVESNLSKIQPVLAKTPEIERAAQRWDQLLEGLPTLQRLLEARTQL